MLHVKIQESGNDVILRCIGRMVRGHETAILCNALRHYGRKIILDFSEVDAIDAAGLGALVTLQAAGIYFQLTNPSDVVRDLLRVTRLDSIFEICGSIPISKHPEQWSREEQVRVAAEFAAATTT